VVSAVSAEIHERKDALRAVPGKSANAEIRKENSGRSGGYVTRLTVQYI
jgi:hypothetical protein